MMHMFANCDNKMMQCSNPVDWKWWTLFWWMINVACTVLFTLEWVMRLFGALAASKVRQLFSDVFTYIDLVRSVNIADKPDYSRLPCYSCWTGLTSRAFRG